MARPLGKRSFLMSADGRSLGQPDKYGGRRYGEHPDGYGRESAPTPYLILYQRSAPLSLTSCPLRDHFLRHIGLLYTGSATARSPARSKAETVLTQCRGSLTTSTAFVPSLRAISATSMADSQVLRALPSHTIAASGTPISRRIPNIT